MNSIKHSSSGRSKEYTRNLGWFLTICFIGMTFIPRSFDHVLFVDGLAYAAISRNMALGHGTFWEPHFADSFWLSFNDRCPFFCEHPPLMFGIESFLFRMLGDATAVENIYNAIILVTSMWLIALIWSKLFEKHTQVKNQAWLPILLWYGLRVVWWSVPNNLLDTTMAVFCLSSCYFQLLAITGNKFKISNWVLSAIMIVLACMTKGPVGLFPLVFPAIYIFVYGKEFLKAGVFGTLTVLITFMSLMFLILLYPPANYFLNNYFQGQVMAALLKKREKISNDWTAHFYLLKLLLINIIPHCLLLIGLFVTNIHNKHEPKISTQTKKAGLLTFLLAASVVLPILVSVKQGDYYLMPALPFVGLFFAACSIELLFPLTSRFPLTTRISFSLISVVFLFSMIYKLILPETDHMFEISKKLSEHIPPNSKIYLPSRIANYSEIHTPFQRYSRLSIAYNPKETRYLFFDDSRDPMLDSIKRTESYRIVNLGHSAILAIKNKY